MAASKALARESTFQQREAALSSRRMRVPAVDVLFVALELGGSDATSVRRKPRADQEVLAAGPNVGALFRPKLDETRFVVLFDEMHRRAHSLSDRTALPLAVIVLICVAMGLLSGIFPALLADTHWPTRQIDDRVGQIEAPNHASVSVVCLYSRSAEELPSKPGEPADPMDVDETDVDETDDDETDDYILGSGSAAFRNRTGLYESPADRAALAPFRLRAFPGRGSPSA